MVLLSAVLFTALAGCQKEKPAPKVGPAGVQPMAEPVFRKEGELEFITSSGTNPKIDIEIADSPDQRMLGLMYRKKMDTDKGMLFIFPQAEEQSFWMKNTFISLDIIYVDSQLQIISIVENAEPMNETSIGSMGPALYVVEVVGGYCKQHGVSPGDHIRYKPAV